MPATALQQDAFAAAESQSRNIVSQEIANRETRYLFYAGDEPDLPAPGGMNVASKCVPRQMLWRCQVTPVMSVPVTSRAMDIPEGKILDGTLDPVKMLAAYELPCGPEVEELLSAYGHPSDQSKQWGLVELTAWRGMQPSKVRELNLTAFFFPGWPRIPEKNKDIEASLVAKLDELMKQPQDELRDKLVLTCRQMITAVQHAQRYQERHIRRSNIRITLPSSDDNFLPDFDSKHHVFAERSGAVLAVNSLRGNSGDATATATAEAIKEVMKNMSQPQAAAPIDPNTIAAIVAATVKALQEPKAEDSKEPKLPVKKAA